MGIYLDLGVETLLCDHTEASSLGTVIFARAADQYKFYNTNNYYLSLIDVVRSRTKCKHLCHYGVFFLLTISVPCQYAALVSNVLLRLETNFS